MYFALNQNIESFDTYLSFLADIIKNNNPDYINIFKDILSEAKKLFETKDFYSVQSERFGIISFFAKNDELINSINVSDLKKDDFERLFNCLRDEIVLESK